MSTDEKPGAVAIVDHRGKALQVVSGEVTPGALIKVALEQGAAIEQLRELLALKREFEQDEARKAYVRAMVAFKKNPPKIWKSKTARVQSKRTGGSYSYDHADLGEIAVAITAGLAAHDMEVRWKTDPNPKTIRVECICTHELGHSESSVFECPPWELVGGNPAQERGAAITFAKRYALLDVTGLHPLGMDHEADMNPEPTDRPPSEIVDDTSRRPFDSNGKPRASDEEINVLIALRQNAREMELTKVAETIDKALDSHERGGSVKVANLIARAKQAIAQASFGDSPHGPPRFDPVDEPPPPDDDPPRGALGDEPPPENGFQMGAEPAPPSKPRAGDKAITRLREYSKLAVELKASNQTCLDIDEALRLAEAGKLTEKRAGYVLGQAVQTFVALGWKKPLKPLVKQRKELETIREVALTLDGGSAMADGISEVLTALEAGELNREQVESRLTNIRIAIKVLANGEAATEDLDVVDVGPAVSALEIDGECQHVKLRDGACCECGEVMPCDHHMNPDERLDVYGKCNRCGARE
jgi:hypothetical protein